MLVSGRSNTLTADQKRSHSSWSMVRSILSSGRGLVERVILTVAVSSYPTAWESPQSTWGPELMLPAFRFFRQSPHGAGHYRAQGKASTS